MNKIIIYTKPTKKTISRESLKRFARYLFKKNRGPSSVSKSLTRGLSALNKEYLLNPKISDVNEEDIVIVNESIEALEQCLQLNMKYLIAGPNLVIHPTDSNKILFDKKISLILEPSEWVANFIKQEAPELSAKIRIWPAGVFIPKESKTIKKKDFLIYVKNNCDTLSLEKIRSFLNQNKFSYTILIYGSFQQEDYFKLLEESYILIYISHSESQGLALLESWARGVPTLVYNRGYYSFKNYKFLNEKISAPYLSKETGLFFNDDNFKEKIKEIYSKKEQFTARDFCAEKFSDKETTKLLLKIISTLN